MISTSLYLLLTGPWASARCSYHLPYCCRRQQIQSTTSSLFCVTSGNWAWGVWLPPFFVESSLWLWKFLHDEENVNLRALLLQTFCSRVRHTALNAMVPRPSALLSCFQQLGNCQIVVGTSVPDPAFALVPLLISWYKRGKKIWSGQLVEGKVDLCLWLQKVKSTLAEASW